MYTSLSPGAIGVRVSGLEEGLALACRHGFEGYHFSIGEAAELGVERVREAVSRTGVRLSAWGFPVDFRGPEERYEQDMARLGQLADVAAALGVLRTATWIMPFSDQLSFDDNFRVHAERLRPAAALLAQRGIRLGLEYVAPATSRRGKRHPFVHTMAGMRQLCAAVGPNAGFLLDSWHWYTAHEGLAELRTLTAAEVVDVHLNDAPAGIAVDEQVDNVRALPAQTGVIDLAGFLRTLRDTGYDGPVMVEPFSEEVRRMPPEEAVAATRAALRRAWTQAGL
ncbi:MAG: sugar phosphate isomerase/epimerase family protein [Candidatus Latescibacterota bacterium]